MKPWLWKRADSEFSLFIRRRDGMCQHPLCPNRRRPQAELECSHFFGRAMWVARYDPDNCIALCHGCHAKWEARKKTQYREYMIRRLGQKRFDQLERRVYWSMANPRPRAEYIRECQLLLEGNV